MTWPCRRARPSRRSAAARCSPATRRSSSAAASSAALRAVTASSSALRCASTWAPISLLLRARTRVGLGLELVGVAARAPASASVAPAALRTRSAARLWVPRSRSRSPPSGEEGLLGLGQRRQVLAQRRLEGGLALPARRPSPASTCSRRSTSIVSSASSCSSAACARDQVVGDQPGLGVADVGLHGRGPAGDLGLAAERLELAADLAEQVAEPGAGCPRWSRACGAPSPCACGA